jgi:hypothetical protein
MRRINSIVESGCRKIFDGALLVLSAAIACDPALRK